MFPGGDGQMLTPGGFRVPLTRARGVPGWPLSAGTPSCLLTCLRRRTSFWRARHESAGKKRRAASGGQLPVCAESEGFEPSVEFPLRRFSKPVPSATRPRLHEVWCFGGRNLIRLGLRCKPALRRWSGSRTLRCVSTWTRLRGALLEVGLALGGLFGGSLIFAALSAFGLLPSDGTLARGVGMAAGPVITLLAVLAYRWMSRRLDEGDPDVPEDAPFPRSGAGPALVWAMLGTLAAIGGSFVLGLLMDLAGAPIEEQDGIVALVESFKAGQGQLAFGMLAVSAVLAAPCAEELLFRGILFRRVVGRGHVPEAFALSAAAFAAIHANLAGFVIYLWLGLVFAEAYRRSGRLWVAMLVHAGNNAFALATLVWG